MPIEKTRETQIAKALITEGERRIRTRRPDYAKHPEADALITDLERYPHAFVTGCVMDIQMKSELAWRIPLEVRRRTGSFEIEDLSRLTAEDIHKVFTDPSSLHRYPTKMAARFGLAIARIMERFEGDASRIWSDKPGSAAVIRRFLGFAGVGSKIGTMAANLLVRDFKVDLGDAQWVDISPDALVRRVFHRLGAYSGDVDHLVRSMPSTWSGACRPLERRWVGFSRCRWFPPVFPLLRSSW